MKAARLPAPELCALNGWTPGLTLRAPPWNAPRQLLAITAAHVALKVPCPRGSTTIELATFPADVEAVPPPRPVPGPSRIHRPHLRWVMPAGAVCVARPSRFANPFEPPASIPLDDVARGALVDGYRTALRRGRLRISVEDVVAQLRHKDLVCWCPLERPCHADVLLELANR